MMKIELLTMRGCVHCEAARNLIEKIRDDFPEMEVEVIDITEHPEISEKYMLMSAPGIVINGKLEFTGGVKEDVLKRRLMEVRGG